MFLYVLGLNWIEKIAQSFDKIFYEYEAINYVYVNNNTDGKCPIYSQYSLISFAFTLPHLSPIVLGITEMNMEKSADVVRHS